MTSVARRQRLPLDVAAGLRRLLDVVQSRSNNSNLPFRQIEGNESDDARAAVLSEMSAWLYATWYTAGDPVGEGPEANRYRRDLAPALRASTAASDRWQTGWVVMQSAQNGFCVAGRKNQTRQLRAGQYANMARPGLPPAPGDSLAVNELLDWVDERTQFWFAQSLVGEPSHPLVRTYWSVGVDQVGFVVREVTSAIDAVGLRYTLKCPIRAAEFARVDSLVVYMEKELWPNAEPVVKALADEIGGRLRTTRPPLTLQIAPGLAFAEDPGHGESFGESRCRALAPGVLSMLREGPPSRTAGIAQLASALEAAGIDPMRPWRNGST